jgi:threonine synthase
MIFYSLNNKEIKASFKEAVIQGIAKDKGLFFPETITPLSDEFWNTIDDFSDEEIAFELIN